MTVPRERARASVIVPVRNAASTIGACLDSILATDAGDLSFEVVVVDNGSSDATRSVLDGFRARIRVVTEPRLGPGAARNAGLRVVEGDVVAFTDADCDVDRHWLIRLTRPIRRGEATVSGGRILAFPEGNDLAQFGERIHDHRKAIEYFRPGYVITMNLAVATETLRAVGGFDERLLRVEDVDIAYRLSEAGHRPVYVHDARVRHHNRDSLRALAVEAWKHGFYSRKVDRLHRDLLDRVAAEERDRPRRPPPPEDYSRELPPARERFLWTWFRGWKRAGRAVGALRAGALAHV